MNILCPNRIPCCQFGTLPARPFILNSPTPPCMGLDYFFFFEASGGVPPYTWELVLGNLPDGLTLFSTGDLIGLPTVGGEFIFTVLVTDSIGQSRAQRFLLTVTMCAQEEVRAVLEEGGVPGAILDEGGGAVLEE